MGVVSLTIAAVLTIVTAFLNSDVAFLLSTTFFLLATYFASISCLPSWHLQSTCSPTSTLSHSFLSSTRGDKRWSTQLAQSPLRQELRGPRPRTPSSLSLPYSKWRHSWHRYLYYPPPSTQQIHRHIKEVTHSSAASDGNTTNEYHEAKGHPNKFSSRPQLLPFRWEPPQARQHHHLQPPPPLRHRLGER